MCLAEVPRAQTVTAQFVLERLAGGAQRLLKPGDISASCAQGVFYDRSLKIRHGQMQRLTTIDRLGLVFRQAQADRLGSCECFQFTHIAGPVVSLKVVPDAIGHLAMGQAEFGFVTGQELSEQGGDVFTPSSQRGQDQPDRAEPVKEWVPDIVSRLGTAVQLARHDNGGMAPFAIPYLTGAVGR